MTRMLASALLWPLLLCGAAPSALAAALSAETKIDAVTIYPDAAIVTRIGALDLPDGDSTVLFTGLPMNLDPASLRIEAAGDTRVEIAGLEF